MLSKLVLLLAPELNWMARAGGVLGDTAYGPELYEPVSPFSVLIGAVASIDGNHQWQEVALPYPRTGTPAPGRETTDPYWPERRHYGRPFPVGFRPLVPGDEDPASIGFPPPNDYVPTFAPTLQHPFPLAIGQSRIVDLVPPRPVPDPLPVLPSERPCGPSF